MSDQDEKWPPDDWFKDSVNHISSAVGYFDQWRMLTILILLFYRTKVAPGCMVLVEVFGLDWVVVDPINKHVKWVFDSKTCSQAQNTGTIDVHTLHKSFTGTIVQLNRLFGKYQETKPHMCYISFQPLKEPCNLAQSTMEQVIGLPGWHHHVSWDLKDHINEGYRTQVPSGKEHDETNCWTAGHNIVTSMASVSHSFLDKAAICQTIAKEYFIHDATAVECLLNEWAIHLMALARKRPRKEFDISGYAHRVRYVELDQWCSY